MHQLPELKFGPAKMSGFLSETTIATHYGKHHQNYLNKLNETVAGTEYESLSIEELLKNAKDLPDSIRQAVINNGGGYFNHNIYWATMTDTPSAGPSGALLEAIEAKYGSFEALGEKLKQQATSLFGSGWVWLMPDLSLVSTANQDNPISTSGQKPLTGVDVWEHAYYLDYKNLRPDYLEKWWQYLDWNTIAEEFAKNN